jgi:hypothetical protein
MDLRDSDDSQLTLDESEGGVYTLGSYASQLISILNDSATNFVSDTTFPYTYTPQHIDDPSFPGDPNLATNACYGGRRDGCQAGGAVLCCCGCPG